MKTRLHAKRHLNYDDQTTGIVWTLCYRNVGQNQIAADESGVTCKKCLANLAWQKEHERPRKEVIA